MRIPGWEERVRVHGISERDALLAEIDDLRQAANNTNHPSDTLVECELSNRQVAALARDVGLIGDSLPSASSPIFAFAAAIRACRDGRRSRSYKSLPVCSDYPSQLLHDPYGPEQMAKTLGLPWSSQDQERLQVYQFTHTPAWKSAPINPSDEMVEIGAKAIAAWEDGSVWPDSWGPDAARHRNDARKAYLAMIHAAPDDGVKHEANRTISALQRLAFRSIFLAYFTDKGHVDRAIDALIHDCRSIGIDSSAKAFEWLSLVCSSREEE